MNCNCRTPKNELLFLITCMFLISAVSGLIALPGNVYTVCRSSGAITATDFLDTIVVALYFIGPIVSIVFSYIVYFMLLRKDLPMSRRSKIGVLLLILSLIIRTVCFIVWDILKPLDCIQTVIETNRFIVANILAGISLFRSIVYIVGLFMFINGCEVSVRMKRFIKWTPFITGIVTMVYDIIIYHILESQFALENYILTLPLSLIYLFVVHRMCKQEYTAQA